MNWKETSTMPGGGGKSLSIREGAVKATVTENITQSVRSTSNLLHLMQQSSSSQAQLSKLPKKLMAKVSTVNRTGHVLERHPLLISSLDAHIDTGLQSLSHLKAASQLLSDMERCQLSHLPRARRAQQEETELPNQPLEGS